MSIARIVLFAAALTAIGHLASTASAAGYNLRGPGPKIGETIRSESETTMTDGTMDIKSGTFQLAGKTDMTLRNVTETTILEMDGDTVTKVQLSFISDVQEQVVEMMGQRNNNVSESPLHGEKVIGTYADGAWSFELAEGDPTPQQLLRLRTLAENYRYVNKTAIVYPDREVELGESWEVDASQLYSHVGVALAPSGKVIYTLEKVEEVDGEPLAHLRVVLDYSASMASETNAMMVMKGEGPLVRSLSSHLDKSSNLKGTMTITMSESEEVEVSMTGAMSVTASEARP